MTETFTNNTNITIGPQIIDGNIRDWNVMIGNAYTRYKKMRVVASPEGVVRVEFYSPWEVPEPPPEPVITEVVEKKPWWKFWGNSNATLQV